MPRYETTFILSPDLEEAALEKNIERYTGIITGRSGTIVKQERWGIRRLAYHIKKKSTGFYMHLVHESGPDVPRELERQFLLNENCLRHLTVRAQAPEPELDLKAQPVPGITAAVSPGGSPAGQEPEAGEIEEAGDWLGEGDRPGPNR